LDNCEATATAVANVLSTHGAMAGCRITPVLGSWT
jgi:hypothetical protein